MIKTPWHITAAKPEDWQGIWAIFHAVVQTGDTYAYAADTTFDQAMDMWVRGSSKAFVAKEGDQVIGSYALRPNQLGRGSHVANASYMVHPDQRGKGIAKALCQHSLEEAKRQGYRAIQFNYVVSTNEPAVKLWQAMGFTIIGTSPKAFQHATLGEVDTYMMHRFL